MSILTYVVLWYLIGLLSTFWMSFRDYLEYKPVRLTVSDLVGNAFWALAGPILVFVIIFYLICDYAAVNSRQVVVDIQRERK